jgi:hypothetical protein
MSSGGRSEPPAWLSVETALDAQRVPESGRGWRRWDGGAGRSRRRRCPGRWLQRRLVTSHETDARDEEEHSNQRCNRPPDQQTQGERKEERCGGADADVRRDTRACVRVHEHDRPLTGAQRPGQCLPPVAAQLHTPEGLTGRDLRPWHRWRGEVIVGAEIQQRR